MTDAEIWGNVLLAIAAVPTTGAVVLYALVPFWRSALGLIMMTKAVSIAALIWFSIIVVIFGASEEFRIFARIFLYLGLIGGQTGVFIYMWKLRYRASDRRRIMPRRKGDVAGEV